MIQVEQLSYSYRQTEILHNLSFSIDKGDMCALMGLNGSGKTTLLKLLARLLPVQNGRVTIDKRPVEEYKLNDLARKIAYVPQQQDIVFDFPVYDTVMMGRHPYQERWRSPSNADHEIVKLVMEQCHLTHLKDRMLTCLSGGELQRVLIARAMAQQSPVILLDEPLANLDIIHKYEIMDILARLNIVNKTTIIIILHELPFAKQYTRKSLFLKEGEVCYFGDTRQLLLPEKIKEVFELTSDYLVDENGNVSKSNIFATSK